MLFVACMVLILVFLGAFWWMIYASTVSDGKAKKAGKAIDDVPPSPGSV